MRRRESDWLIPLGKREESKKKETNDWRKEQRGKQEKVTEKKRKEVEKRTAKKTGAVENERDKKEGSIDGRKGWANNLPTE